MLGTLFIFYDFLTLYIPVRLSVLHISAVNFKSKFSYYHICNKKAVVNTFKQQLFNHCTTGSRSPLNNHDRHNFVLFIIFQVIVLLILILFWICWLLYLLNLSIFKTRTIPDPSYYPIISLLQNKALHPIGE